MSLTVASLRAVLSEYLPQAETSRLAAGVERLPDPASALRALEAFRSETRRPIEPARLLNFLTLAGFSPYLASLLAHNPEFLEIIPPGGLPRGPRTREDLEEDLARFIHLSSGRESSLVLRRFMKRELLCIALADLLSLADLSAVTGALSLLADVLLDRALLLARAPLEARYGSPTCRDDQGHLEAST